MKTLIHIVLWLIAALIVLLLTIPLWFGPVVRPIANALVPSKTGTDFNVSQLSLNPYVGHLAVGDVRLANPSDFKQKLAFTLGSLSVDVDVASLASDVVVIKDVRMRDLFVSYVSNERGENNFAVIKRNAAGGDAAKVPVESAKTSPASSTPATKSKDGKRFIIDHVLIENVLVQLGPVSVPIPKIELKGLGRAAGGESLEVAWGEVWQQMLGVLAATGEQARELVRQLGVSISAADLQGAAEKILKQSNAILGTAGGAAKGTLDSTGEAAKKTLEAFKGLLKK